VARLDEISLADPKFGTPYPVTREDPAVFFHDWLETEARAATRSESGRLAAGDPGAAPD
jgi:hypothetical protein